MKSGDTVHVSYLASPGPRPRLGVLARVLRADGGFLTVEIEGRPPIVLERVPEGERPLKEGPWWQKDPLRIHVAEEKAPARRSFLKG